MIIIGEKLNSSIKSSLNAMVRALNGDDTAVVELICRQEESGAALLDINTALTGDEPGAMELIVRLIQKHSNCGVMPDSPNPDILYRVRADLRQELPCQFLSRRRRPVAAYRVNARNRLLGSIAPDRIGARTRAAGAGGACEVGAVKLERRRNRERPRVCRHTVRIARGKA